MNKNIKGITIELGGNTGPLGNALKDVEKTSRDLQSELKEVNKQLKFDPTNTTLLKQKQDLLAQSITNTKDKLTTLKEAEKQAEQQFQEGKIGEENYRALQREVVKTKDELKNLEKQAKDTNSVIAAKLESAGSKIEEVGGKISGAGEKLAPVTLSIIGAGAASAKLASDAAESANKVEVAFGKSSDTVKEFSKTTLDSYGIASGSALDMAATFGDMATSMGLPTDKAATMSTKLVGLAGDLSSFKNIWNGRQFLSA